MIALKRLSDKLNKIVEKIIAVLLAVMAVVVFSQVIFRYVFHASLPWSEELSRYILVWLTFLGASIGVKRNSHIGVEAVVSLLPNKMKKVVEFIANILSLSFFLVLIIYGSKVVKITMMQLSPAMKIKMGYIYSAIIVGAVLMVIHLITRMFHHDKFERV